MKRSTSLLVLPVAALLSVGAARVEVGEVEASSAYPPEDGIRYDAKMAVDGRLSTSWVEGEDGSGLGSWLRVAPKEQGQIAGLRIWAGLWSSYDFWTRANRPKTIEVKFDDGTTEVLELADKMEAQTLMFAKPHAAGSVRIRVKAIYNGNTWFDTAISEVQLIGVGSPDFVEPTGYAVSSQLPDDGDGNYKPENMTDGVLDSMWCEGSKDGDGTNEFIEVKFAKATSVSSVSLVNGVGGHLPSWMNSNRATKARLTFSDGSSQEIVVKNSASLQTISFQATTTSSVRLTFTEVYKGKEYNDLCVSELYFR
jgi:hypothetical protein